MVSNLHTSYYNYWTRQGLEVYRGFEVVVGAWTKEFSRYPLPFIVLFESPFTGECLFDVFAGSLKVQGLALFGHGYLVKGRRPLLW